MTTTRARSSPPVSAGPGRRRGLGMSIFVLVMVLACIVALLATALFLTGTYITGVLPTPIP